MKANEHDELWDLLGKAEPLQVSPFFSRNVLRAVRKQTQDRPGFFALLLRRQWLATAVTAASLLLASAAFFPWGGQTDSSSALAEQFAGSSDYEVVGHLDELLDTEQNSVWLAN